jgi:SAM-dependent methyltransferase
MDLNDLGRTGRFDELLRLLQSANYTDDFIQTRFKLRRAEDFELERNRRAPLPAPESATDILTALFLAGETVSMEIAARMLGSEGIGLLEGMGLLSAERNTGRCHATVALYPVADIYIASDRWSDPDGLPWSGPQDMVYPAFIPNTRLFLRHLPERPAGDFLDLCAGTGAGALLAAKRGTAQAWSVDIADRSTRFAEFNRRLNGFSSVYPVTSDLYEKLERRRFDMITAHPPYVPALQPKWIFFSGGRDGEEITRRCIEGLPDHLNDGGVFLALTMGGDRVDQPFESRIRRWLGASEREFDIALIVRKEIALRANRETIRTREEAEAWNRLFASLQVTSLVYGFVCIQRRSGARKTFTVRRQAAQSNSRSPWEWLLAWETAATGDSLTRIILDSRLHASLETEFDVVHRLGQAEWKPASYKLRTDHVFSMECSAQPWMAHMLSLCVGRTGREVLAELVRNGVLPEAVPEDEFAHAAATLVSGGFLEVEGFRPPQGAK